MNAIHHELASDSECYACTDRHHQPAVAQKVPAQGWNRQISVIARRMNIEFAAMRARWHLCKVMKEGCGIDGGCHKGYRPRVLCRQGREGRQGCPHTVTACNHARLCNPMLHPCYGSHAKMHGCSLGEPFDLPHNPERYLPHIPYIGWAYYTIQALYQCQPKHEILFKHNSGLVAGYPPCCQTQIPHIDQKITEG